MMKFLFRLTLCLAFLGTFDIKDTMASEVVWKGEVMANGNPTQTIDLTINKTYQFTVSGSVNLGKWVEAGKQLAQDAAFEYNAPSGPTRLESLKNSSNIPLNDKLFNPEHVYKSEPFVAKQNKIHFWIYDTDYSDNSGSLKVEIHRLN